MSAIEPIASATAQQLSSVLPQHDLVSPADLQQTPQAGAVFSQLVSQGLQGINEQLMVNQKDLQALASGKVDNLHDVMIRLEESRVSFQLMMQVRARLLEAYQDIMKMQV